LHGVAYGLGIDLLHILDEIQAVARTGLSYATDPYDRERYERLLALAVDGYSDALSLPPEEVRARLARDLGYVTAKVGAEAAIFDDDDRILLIQRSDDGCWALVSGYVDAGESPAGTIVREVREEIGLELTIDALVDVFGRPASASNGPHGTVGILYLGSVAPGEVVLSHETLDARYWDIESVTDWHKNHKEYALAALARRSR
jgi:ADP-ribose pyrophosphatase YjhB (NUDIX family)